MECGIVGGLKGILCEILDLLGYIIPILITIGVLYFVWGVVTYMIGADEEQKTKGRDKIMYGLIGLAVIVAMWGLVYILTDTFGLREQNNLAPTPGQLDNMLPKMR